MTQATADKGVSLLSATKIAASRGTLAESTTQVRSGMFVAVWRLDP
jgi:hypothetical protein